MTEVLRGPPLRLDKDRIKKCLGLWDGDGAFFDRVVELKKEDRFIWDLAFTPRMASALQRAYYVAKEESPGLDGCCCTRIADNFHQ